jgi:hypothetical protein
MSKASPHTVAADLADLPRSDRVARLFGFDPFDYQAEILDSPERHVTWVCGRQVGKTETTAALVADYALMHADADVLIGAKYQETANELFGRVKDHIEGTGVGLQEAGVKTSNAETWEFTNGSRIMSRTLGTDASQQRGKLPQCVVIEEAALVEGQVYDRVIQPMFATHDDYELYLASTPRGKTGYLYEKHVHDDSWGSYHVPTSENPLVDDAWLADRRDEVDTVTWRQEYLGEFVESEDAYLPMSIVRPCVADDSEALGDEYTGECYLGVDVARGGRDRSVFMSIDDEGRVFDLEATANQPLTDDVGRIKRLNDRYGYAAIHIDENAIGGGVVDFAAEDLGHVEAVPFSTKKKQQMYQTLKKRLEDGDLRLPDNDRLIDELTALKYSFTSTGLLQVRHPSGGRDDYPDALALAVNALANAAGQGAPTATATVGSDGNGGNGDNPIMDAIKRAGRRQKRVQRGNKWK